MFKKPTTESRFQIRDFFQKAVEQNDLATVERILNQEQWLVNWPTLARDKHSFLYLAAEKGFVSVAKLLIRANADVNQPCFAGNTPLIIASKNGHDEMVELLLLQPETMVDLSNDLEQTPLSCATVSNHDSVAKRLLRSKATIEPARPKNLPSRIENIKNLQMAITHNDIKTVADILEREKFLANRLLEGREFTFLCLAAKNGFHEIAQLLIAANANVNQPGEFGRTALVAATIAMHMQLVALLVQHPNICVDIPDDCRATALHHAMTTLEHLNIASLLLQANACVDCVDNQGRTPLILAAAAGLVPTLQLLLQHNANVDHWYKKGTSLLAVAQRGFDDAVAVLLDAKANVDMTVANATPLMVAAENQRLSTVRLLLQAGANVNHSHSLLCAVRQQHSAIVQELLQAAADPNLTTFRGFFALQTAAEIGFTDGISQLLAAKADINAKDQFGGTALCTAIASNRAESAMLLLENGADILVKARYSARQCARWAKAPLESIFGCSLCGWTKMCCFRCRTKYCVKECDKYSDPQNEVEEILLDCRQNRKLAHQAVLEWTLAMAPLQLPPYVLENVFSALKWNDNNKDYQQRKAIDFLWIPKYAPTTDVVDNYIHLIVEERTHQENIKLFISVFQAQQKKTQ